MVAPTTSLPNYPIAQLPDYPIHDRIVRSPMNTLLSLLESIPAERTAIIIPESNIRLSYGDLRDQITALAESLAAAGVERGDRVGIALPNGLPVIVAFFAAAAVGTAAPLNPSYKEEEFRFYLEDTNARVLLLPPDGLDEARTAAAEGGVPVLSIDVDTSGIVSIAGVDAGATAATPDVDDVAL